MFFLLKKRKMRISALAEILKQNHMTFVLLRGWLEGGWMAGKEVIGWQSVWARIKKLQNNAENQEITQKSRLGPKIAA